KEWRAGQRRQIAGRRAKHGHAQFLCNGIGQLDHSLGAVAIGRPQEFAGQPDQGGAESQALGDLDPVANPAAGEDGQVWSSLATEAYRRGRWDAPGDERAGDASMPGCWSAVHFDLAP